jgi:hypothetical protein
VFFYAPQKEIKKAESSDSAVELKMWRVRGSQPVDSEPSTNDALIGKARQDQTQRYEHAHAYQEWHRNAPEAREW